eukprot:CAMPEP_0116034138 /NCGR_PEP_ID=MMETSP0321-20121206/19422_1 /TAXON_ID=163516 /ORGANISM="Leptocylindrus danicus var. danicus, Strain B650" /LENGTH=522 /DNA_ID=CAMNT_0003510379 /DNA_START=195 /DNA_END=1763 /DNA_ORIENTATION=-
MTARLRSDDIPNVASAGSIFGEDTTLMVARPGKNALCCCVPTCWFTVPEGYYALVSRFGSEEDYSDGNPVWPSGLHIGPPWLRVTHLVTKQSMVFNTPIKGCKTSDNVTVQIDMSIVLRVMGDEPSSERPNDHPSNVRKFIHHLTAAGLREQLIGAQAEAVRTMARSVTHTEVFGLRTLSAAELEENMERIKAAASFSSSDEDGEDGGAYDDKQERKDLEGEHDDIDQEEAAFAVEYGSSMVTKNLKKRLNKQFKPQGVEIQDVIIEKISLPNDIQSQMSQKTMVISQNAEQRMQHKFDLQVLEQTEAIKMLRQTQEEEKLELIKDGEARVIEETLTLNHMKEEAARDVKRIEVQNWRDVNMILAGSDTKVTKCYDLCEKEVSRITLTANAEASMALADARYHVASVKAKGDLECSRLMAQADKTMFAAEGVSAPKVRTLNNHITSMRHMSVQESLAGNEKLVIAGKSGGIAASKLLLADACLADAQAAGKISRSDAIAELAIASGKADVRLYTSGVPGRVG